MKVHCEPLFVLSSFSLPPDCDDPPKQQSIPRAATLDYLPRVGLHDQGVHEAGVYLLHAMLAFVFPALVSSILPALALTFALYMILTFVPSTCLCSPCVFSPHAPPPHSPGVFVLDLHQAFSHVFVLHVCSLCGPHVLLQLACVPGIPVHVRQNSFGSRTGARKKFGRGWGGRLTPVLLLNKSCLKMNRNAANAGSPPTCPLHLRCLCTA